MTSVAVKPLWYCDSTVVRNNQYWGCGDFDDIELNADENADYYDFGELSQIEIVVIMVYH